MTQELTNCTNEDVLDATLLRFVAAKKTKSIKVRPIQTLLSDETFLNKLLLATLEGSQMLKASSMVCVGPAGDIWQQTQAKLHKQYTPVELGVDGWVTFVPKPENERDACEITLASKVLQQSLAPGEGVFTIKAQWGEQRPDGTFTQKGKSGDYVLRSQEDPTEVWIVARSVFENTYELK